MSEDCIQFKHILYIAWQCTGCGGSITARQGLHKNKRTEEAWCYASHCHAIYHVDWGNGQEEIRVKRK